MFEIDRYDRTTVAFIDTSNPIGKSNICSSNSDIKTIVNKGIRNLLSRMTNTGKFIYKYGSFNNWAEVYENRLVNVSIKNVNEIFIIPFDFKNMIYIKVTLDT